MSRGSRPGEHRGGRKPGTPNHERALTIHKLRQTVLDALDEKGGVEYFKRVADSHPSVFCALVGKLIPLQIEGAPGGAPIITGLTWHPPQLPPPLDQ